MPHKTAPADAAQHLPGHFVVLFGSRTTLSGSASAATSPEGRGLGRPVLAALDE